MKKKLLFVLFTVGLIVNMYGQSNVTNNNTITINGNVYYFRPSTTPSSPLPDTPTTNFIGEGHWYGADAARAWASISDWAIEHCIASDSPVRPRDGERVYIHQVHAIPRSNRRGLENIRGAEEGAGLSPNIQLGVIKIFYWVVGRNAQMDEGRRATRTFYF